MYNEDTMIRDNELDESFMETEDGDNDDTEEDTEEEEEDNE